MTQSTPPVRKQIRLTEFDYTSPGAYFVTLIARNRLALFGQVLDGVMQPNAAGEMIERWWAELACKFAHTRPGVCIVMPNHFHGIIEILPDSIGADLRVGPDLRVGLIDAGENHTGAHTGAPLQEIIQWFKTMTTNEYIRGVKSLGWTRFYGKLWQRSYYEHIVRNDQSLARIEQYIVNNPANWETDQEYRSP